MEVAEPLERKQGHLSNCQAQSQKNCVIECLFTGFVEGNKICMGYGVYLVASWKLGFPIPCRSLSRHSLAMSRISYRLSASNFYTAMHTTHINTFFISGAWHVRSSYGSRVASTFTGTLPFPKFHSSCPSTRSRSQVFPLPLAASAQLIYYEEMSSF